MANRRMLSKSISYSRQVHNLTEFVQLLFTWTIPHLDDFGRIDGDAEVLRAMVMPMSSRLTEDFEEAISNMEKNNLIIKYVVDTQKVIQYPGFERHQTGLHKRTKSKYPDPPGFSENFQELPQDSVVSEQNLKELNLSEINLTENNISEANQSQQKSEENPFRGNGVSVNPKTFEPKTESESAAFEAWRTLEPYNPLALATTYLWALKNGLPPDIFYQFVSEIKDDPNIRNKGALFRVKAEDYFKSRDLMLDP